MDKKEMNELRDKRIAETNAAHEREQALKLEDTIPKEKLVDGAYYRGQCRNANYARWFAKQNRFTHWRTKFGNRFLEDILCPEDDQVFDVFYAKEVIPEPVDVKDRIEMTEIDDHRLHQPKQ